MQKVIIGLVGVVLIVGAFFLFSSKKIIEVKVDEQIAMLQAHGFEVNEKVQDTNTDVKHFVVSLVDTDKFVQHFPEYKKALEGAKKDILKKFKFGVDVTSSAATVSADIYPVSFPKETFSQEERDIFQKLIDKKALFLKMNYNGVTKKIDGTLRDIDEKIKDIGIKVTGLNFNDISGDKIDIKYNIKNLNLSSFAKDKFVVDVKDISSNMSYAGVNNQILNGFVKFDKMFFESNNIIVNVIDTNIEIITDVKNNLFDSGIKTTIKLIDADIAKKKVELDDFIFDYGISNINLEAFNKLVKLLDENGTNFDSPEVTTNVEKILSNGVEIYLNKFGVDNIKYDQESLKGFSVKSKINILKDSNFLKNIQVSPMLAISAIEMKSKIEVSDELFSIIIKDPKAMMLMMFKPKDENGHKVYDIDLKDGALNINGQPMM